MLNYNKEMFEQTLLAATLSFVEFSEPIKYDDNLLKFGLDYIKKLIDEPAIAEFTGRNPDRYYYMIATHALYTGFLMSLMEKDGYSREKVLKDVTTNDSIAIFGVKVKDVDTEDVDSYASFVFDMSINDLQNKYKQKFVISNKNKYILGMLCAFFVIGYNLKKEYFIKPDNNDSSSEQESLDDSHADDSLTQFYYDCVKDFHDIAKERGFIKKGIVLIPELIPIGNKTVIAYLQDPFFKTEYKNNLQMYYYAVMVFTLQTAMIFANKWHFNFSGLTPEYIDQVIKDGPADEGIPLLKQIGLTDNEKENIFYRAIFDKFFEKLKPYANNKDLGNYTFQAMLAAYQLGVSMILSDYGF